jgi:hypothetical protein
MGLTAFIQRDITEYILPTIIALALFLPIWSPDSTIEQVVFGGAILGFLIFAPARWIANIVIMRLPTLLHLPFARYLRTAIHERRWWQQNFDYGVLWYSLSKDDREYLYGTRAYYHFYLLISLYVISYAAVNFAIFLHALVIAPVVWNASIPAIRELWNIALSAETPLLFKNKLPAVGLGLVSCALAKFALQDMFEEYRVLFFAPGQYVTLAKLYHERQGAIAKSVWGRLLLKSSDKPVSGAQLTLTDAKGRFTQTVTTDNKGRWQFVDALKRAPISTLRLSVAVASCRWEYELSLDVKTIPEFEIFIEDVPQPLCEAARNNKATKETYGFIQWLRRSRVMNTVGKRPISVTSAAPMEKSHPLMQDHPKSSPPTPMI